MTNTERYAAITILEGRLINALDAYILATRKKETKNIKKSLYNEVQRIKKEIVLLKAPG